jgi:cytosine deaminase
LLAEGAEQSDFVGLLPERDAKERYPEHIGFSESCRRALILADQLGKKIHIHTDQANHIDQSESELIVSLVEKLGLGVEQGSEPFIWLIHVISPSTYDEPRFLDLARRLADQNIGVICCPSAAVSMRQYRPVQSPTYNCIARVLDLLGAGVWVRLGSDNVCDITSPMGTVDLMDELAFLGNAMRFYDVDVLARIGAGQRLTEKEIDRIRAHIALDTEFVAEFMCSVDRACGDTD